MSVRESHFHNISFVTEHKIYHSPSGTGTMQPKNATYAKQYKPKYKTVISLTDHHVFDTGQQIYIRSIHYLASIASFVVHGCLCIAPGVCLHIRSAYMHTYVCMHACMHICIYIYIYIYIYMCVCIVCIFVYVYIYIRIFVYLFIHLFKIGVNTYLYTNIHDINMYIYI